MKIRQALAGLLFSALALFGSSARLVQAEPIAWKVWGAFDPGHPGETIVLSNDLGHPQSGVDFSPWTDFSPPPILHVRAATVPIAAVSASWSTNDGNTNEIAQFSSSKNSFTLYMSLMDVGSGKIGTLTFSGSISGTVSSSDANLSTIFLGPTTQALDVGGRRYTLTIGPFTSPSAPPFGDSSSGVEFPNGSLGVHVDVQPDVHDTPEPSTLVLGGLGFAGLAFARRRRRLAGIAAS